MSSIIIDFDGTVADSLPLVLDLFYKWSGRPEFSKSEIERFRGMHVKEVLAEMRVPIWKVPGILVKHRGEFGRRIGEVSAFTGIAAALKQLHDKGHRIHIMSTNSTQNVQKFIKAQQLEKIFDSVNGNVGVFGKTSALRLIIKRYKIGKNDCYSVGDEVRDIEAAKKAGVKSIAVSWGYNSETILKTHKPDYLIHNPSELVELLQ